MVVENVSNGLYDCAKKSKSEFTQEDNSVLGRWERLTMNKGDLKLWRAINWKGEYSSDYRKEEVPSDDEFKGGVWVSDTNFGEKIRFCIISVFNQLQSSALPGV